MDDKRGKFGIGELLFGLVIILGIIGTISFFAFEDLLGEHRPSFLIASSLAFIASYFALFVYTHAKKRSYQQRRMNLDRALANWIEYMGLFGSTGSAEKNLPAGTVESIVVHASMKDEFRLAPGGTKKSDNLVRLVNNDGHVKIIRIAQDHQPVGLREVIAFNETMRAEQAGWGEIWALGGFTGEALNWVSRKPIQLVDTNAIHKTIDDLVSQKRNPVSRVEK